MGSNPPFFSEFSSGLKSFLKTSIRDGQAVHCLAIFAAFAGNTKQGFKET